MWIKRKTFHDNVIKLQNRYCEALKKNVDLENEYDIVLKQYNMQKEIADQALELIKLQNKFIVDGNKTDTGKVPETQS